MAKWGEGDPRWIVEERPDATNVNNWHWTEKKASIWSKDKLTELLEGLEIKQRGLGSCKITEIDEIEGEASASSRKAKLFFFYEWHIRLIWEGNLENSKTKVKGKVVIPNLSEENNPEEVVVDVELDDHGDEADILKELMRTKGTHVIQDVLAKYVHALKRDFSQGMILPSKESQRANLEISRPHLIPTNVKSDLKSKNGPICANNVSDSVDINNLTSLSLKEEMKCTAEELFTALTQKEFIEAFTRAPAIIVSEPGGFFSLMEGAITGKFLSLNPPKKIVQLWRCQNWPESHFSTVTFELNQKDDCTELIIMQIDVPLIELERTREGWLRYYIDGMKRMLGFGAPLF